jgi:hypothetical protein
MPRHERDVAKPYRSIRPARAAARPRDGAGGGRERPPYASQRELVTWSLVAVPDAREVQGGHNAKAT